MEDELLDYGGDPKSKQEFYNFLMRKNLPITAATYAEEVNLQLKPAENLQLGTGSGSAPLTAEHVYGYLMDDNMPQHDDVCSSGAGDYNPVGNQAFTGTTSMQPQSSSSFPPNAYPVLPAPGPSRKRQLIPDQVHADQVSASPTGHVEPLRSMKQRMEPSAQQAPNRRADQSSSSRVLSWPSMGSSHSQEQHHWSQPAPAAGGGNPSMVRQVQAEHPLGSFHSQKQHHWSQPAPAAGGGNPSMVPQVQAGHPIRSFHSQEQHHWSQPAPAAGGGNPSMVPQAQAGHSVGSFHSQEQHHWSQPAPAARGGNSSMVPQAQAGQMGSFHSQELRNWRQLAPAVKGGNSTMVPQVQGHFRNPQSNVGPAGSRTAGNQPHHNYSSRPPPVVPRPPTPSVKAQTHTQDKEPLNEVLWGRQPRIWKALDEPSASSTSRAQPYLSMGSSTGSIHYVPYGGMPLQLYNLPQAQAGHTMMVPRPDIGSSSSQQIHFTNAPRNVDPARFRTSVGEPRQSSASLPPDAHHALPAPPQINMPNVHLGQPVFPDPNQLLEAVDPNQQLEAVIPTTAPGSLDHVS